MEVEGGSAVPDVRHLAAVTPEPEPDPEATGVSLELLDELRPYLAESLMVLDHDWTIKANLAPPGGLIGRGLGLGLHTLEDMHPDDAVKVMELGVHAFSTEPGWRGSRFVRMRTGDGTYGRYEITAINRFGDPVIDGMVVRTREVPHDLAEEWSGPAPASAVETLAELLPIGVLLFDSRSRVVFANDNACGMLDREPEQLKREGIVDAIHPDHRRLVTEVLARVTSAPSRESCTVRLVVGARSQDVELHFSSDGAIEVSSIVVTMEDVTERHANQRDLEERANHDHLTGLRNRASLHEVLQARIGNGQATSVAYLDLDGFKAVNDTWGHERGDQVLVAVAHALRIELGPEPVVARLGGDEFVVAVDAGDDDALDARLRAAVARVARAEGLSITCSVGVARTRHDDESHDVVRRADHRMYAAKGRRP